MTRRAKAKALSVLMAIGLTACGTTDSGSSSGNDEIRIVTALPLSGPLADPGQDVLAGAKIARDMVNADGGVDGREVSFDEVDVPDPEAAVSEVNRSISQNDAKVVFCCYSSSISLAASQVTERNGVVMVEPSAISPEITARGFKNLLRPTASATTYAEVSVSGLESVLPALGGDPAAVRAAIIYEHGSYGTAYAAAVNDGLKELGVPVVASQGYDPTSSDLTPLVLATKSARPDVILAASYTNDAILFTDQARQQGLEPKLIIGSGGGFSSQAFLKSQGPNAEGILEVSSSAVGISDSALSEQTAEARKEFYRRYEQEYDELVNNQALLGFDGMWALLRYIMPGAEDPTDPGALMEAAHATSETRGALPGGSGLKFDETGQNTEALVTMQQWQKGKLVTVFPEDASTSKFVSTGRP